MENTLAMPFQPDESSRLSALEATVRERTTQNETAIKGLWQEVRSQQAEHRAEMTALNEKIDKQGTQLSDIHDLATVLRYKMQQSSFWITLAFGIASSVIGVTMYIFRDWLLGKR